MIRIINKSYGVVAMGRVLLMYFSCCGISLVQADDWIYKVRNGDNLWNLTVDYLIDISYVQRVQKLNNIADPWHILPGTQIRIPNEWIRRYPALVRIQSLQGDARILEYKEDQAKSLQVGTIAMLGDTLITSANGSLVLGFLDGSRIFLQENSRLRIDRLMLLENTGMSDSRLHLEVGRMETQVASDIGTARRFEIKTPATVTSVRGTDYRVSAELENSESRTEVVEGKVVVKGSRKSRLLTTGFGTITIKDQEPLPPIKLLPAPDVSGLPDSFDQVPIQLTMPALVQAQGYRVQIAKTALFQEVLFDQPAYTDIIRGPDLPDGDYQIRIRAIDTQKLEGLNAQRQITINAHPEAPFLVSPTPGMGIILEQSPEFVWSRQQQIKQYHLQVAKDQGFTEILVDKQGVEESQLTITKELVLGKYYWRIAAVDKDGDGPFSDGQMFRRILPAPELEAPDITEETLVIRSRSGLPGQTYHFQMSDDESFSELLVDKHTDEPGFEMDRPDGGEYFIRVQTIDPDGFVGPFGAVQSIDVPYSDLYWLLVLLPLLALIAL